MIYLLMFVYLVLFPVAVIGIQLYTLNKIKDLKFKQISTTKQIRKHPSIEKSNYDNVFGGRTAYEIYKNKDGLYEPVTPSKGVKIEKKEE